jgi:hypothetical protein
MPSIKVGRMSMALVCLGLVASAPRQLAAASDGSMLRHQLRFSAEDFESEWRDGKLHYKVRGGSTLLESGAPALPVLPLRFVMPRGTQVRSALLQATEWEAVGRADDLAVVAPLMSSDGESVTQMPYESSQTHAKAQGEFPASPLVVGAHGFLHGYSIVELELFPMRVRADGVVERLAAATIEMGFDAAAEGETDIRRLVDWPGLRAMDRSSVETLVLNPESVPAYAPPRGDSVLFQSGKAPTPNEGHVEWVVVTTPELAGEFERLAQHRRETGLSAAVVTVDWILANYRNGSDLQETIRRFFAEAYANWGLRYALIGGDADLVAPRYARSNFYPSGSSTDIPTDAYFGCLDGNWNANGNGLYGEAYLNAGFPGDLVDLIPEFPVGRAPVRDLAQTTTFIDKVIEYERPTNPSIHGNALFLSEVLFPSNWDGIAPITLDGATYSEDIIFDSIIGGLNFVQSWRLYENYTPYIGATQETLIASLDSINSGNFGLVTHVGHGFYYNASVGDGNIFAVDAKSLTNGPNYFWLHALNCSSAAFDFDCLLEAFVQNPNGGSVLSIGSSRAAFPTTADYFEQIYFDQLFVQNKLRVGDAMVAARLVAGPGTAGESAIRWTQFTYCLLGDPAIRLWRQTPKGIDVVHASSVAQGALQYSIDVNLAAGGAGVVGASAVLLAPDGTMRVGQTGAGGVFVFDLGGLAAEPGQFELHVSGQTVMPYAGTVTITAPTGSRILASLSSVNDDAILPSSGDGDGAVDAGETVELYFNFLNNGDGNTASNVSATLNLVDGGGVVTVIDGSVAVGTLSFGASIVPADPCVLAIDPGAADGTEIELELITSRAGASWSKFFVLQILAPQLDVTRVRFDDNVGGNGDGIVQNGESVELFVELTNFGAGDIAGVTGTLGSASPNVSITDANNSWSGLTLKSPVEGAGSFALSESDASVENWLVLDLVDEYGRALQHRLELRPPSVPLDPTPDTSLSPTSIGLRMDPPLGDLHFAGFRVYRSDASGGPYGEVTQAHIQNSGFFEDAGLAPLTRYYYMISAVDSSLVEGGASNEVDASTAPPELPGGFPLLVADEIVGPVAVGDMHGDGSLVVGYSADFVYAVDSDGNELIDGDLDSQTLGPLFGPPSPNNKWTPSGVSMADLDGDGDMELIASNWKTFEIFVLEADGSMFPGWPRAMNNGSWAVPAIGDLDNNGDLEIVVNNVAGWTYVWNHDGTDFFDGDSNPATVGKFHQRVGENFNRSTPALYDVDNDGKLEIIFGTHLRQGQDNFVHALRNDATDAPGWGKNLGPAGYNVTSISIADIDRDGVVELVYPCDDDFLYVWEPDGSNEPGFPIAFTSQGANRDAMTPSPAFADFDKDGDLEMVLVSIINKSLSYMYVMEHDGTTWPGWPVALSGLSYSSPIVGDLDGDFFADIIFGVGGGGDGLPNIVYGFNADARPLIGFPISLNGAPEAPQVICDLDQDGDVDLVSGGLDRLLHVWDMPFPYHPWETPWPTFHGNNRRTGVYLEDFPVAAGRGSFELSATRGGLVVRALIEGALPADARFTLERREQREESIGEYRVVAEAISFDDGQFYWVDPGVRPGVGYRYRVSDGRGLISFESKRFDMPVMRLQLAQNIPNPFNPSTTVVFTVPGIAGSKVPATLAVYDLSGRKVRTLVSGPLSPGEHVLVWNGDDEAGATVSSGTYFAVLRCAGEQRSMKMSLLK